MDLNFRVPTTFGVTAPQSYGMAKKPSSLFDMPIYTDICCVETTDEPVRKHIQKPHMSDFYHYRIQKKWLKRWGFKTKPTAYIINNKRVVCHPDIYQEIKRQFGA